MPSPQSHFQPPPPIRTSTAGSEQSRSSRAMSPTSDIVSPTSTYSQSSHHSAAEESFFGAIASKVRRARSRSRSRNSASRNRSKSPMVLPPDNFPSTSSRHTVYSSRPQQPRHSSSASHSSKSSSKPQRPSLQGPTRRSTGSSDMWRGRHSNSWLFNDFSVTDTAKDIFHIGRKS